jgi:hypothetical protein
MIFTDATPPIRLAHMMRDESVQLFVADTDAGHANVTALRQ